MGINTSSTSINNEMTISASNIPLTTYMNNNDSPNRTSQTKLNKKKRVLSQRNISVNELEKQNKFRNQKKNTKNSMKNLTTKLTAGNYVKPLYYMMNDKIIPVKKPFGYRYDRNFLFIPYPKVLNIDYSKYRTIVQQNEEKKENSKNKKSKSKSKSKPKKNLKSKSIENVKSPDKNLKNKNNKKNKN